MTFALPVLVFADILGSRVGMKARLFRDISLDREETTAVWGIKTQTRKTIEENSNRGST